MVAGAGAASSARTATDCSVDGDGADSKCHSAGEADIGDGEPCRFVVRACIYGYLLESNEDLVHDPSLIVHKANTSGYVAIIQPRYGMTTLKGLRNSAAERTANRVTEDGLLLDEAGYNALCRNRNNRCEGSSSSSNGQVTATETVRDGVFNLTTPSGRGAAHEYMTLWQSGRCDEEAHAELQEILSRCPLSGRMIHGFPPDRDPGFGRLLSSDEWKRLSWVFGPDALSSFLGKDARGICLELGFGETWLEQKLKEGKLFKLAIFPSSSADAAPATWDGVEKLLEAGPSWHQPAFSVRWSVSDAGRQRWSMAIRLAQVHS